MISAMNKPGLRTSYSNALSNFRDLYAKVAVDRQTVVLHGHEGDEVVWISLTDFLEQNSRGPSCEEILAELTTECGTDTSAPKSRH